MAAEVFEGFIPEKISNALIDYFAEFGFECHLRTWEVTKHPGMEEYDVAIKIHSNKKTGETPLTE